ncbi:MAG: hypothetical protein LBG47_03680 [Prevotellaceae bacterium]|nr:hypothetical protein [Prevotellaceae bacterium]
MSKLGFSLPTIYDATACYSPVSPLSGGKTPEIPPPSPRRLYAKGRFGKSGKSATLHKNFLVKDLVNSNGKGGTPYEKASELADRVIEGTARIVRLNRKEEAGRIAGGRRNVEASIVAGAHKRDSAVGESSAYEDVRVESGKQKTR